MTELEKLCEQALYEEIQDLGDGKSIVRDVPTGRLFYRKELTVYNLQVFSWLKDHRDRSVPRIESFREDEGKLIVIEEYVQGRTLENLLEEADEPLPFRERIRILTEICDGLSFLHSAQPPIIHRDLKASNIMLTEDGVVKIIDYDAAKVYVHGEKKDTVLMGTHGIAAPEQYGFAPSDVRTDIYGLGKLIERMLPDNVDADRIVARATHIDPKKRYASASQIREQILRIREHPSSLDTRLEKVIPGFDPRKKAHRVLARAAITLLCAAVLAVAGFSIWQFGIYPRHRQQAMAAELSVIQSKETEKGEIPALVGQYLDKYPYERMSEAEQLDFRNAMEKALSRYGANQDDRQNLLSMLSERCGGKETAESIDQYAEVESLLSNSQYEKAFESLRELRKAGSPEAEEKWADALNRCLEKASALEKDFEDKKEISSAIRALNMYALIISAADSGTNADTDTNSNTGTDTGSAEDSAPADEVLSSFDRLYELTLEHIDQESEAGSYDQAKKEYSLLQELPAIGLAGQTDLEEKLHENTYRKAQASADSGQYSSALNLFKDLGDYKDSADRVLECHYQLAGQHMDQENYKAAAVEYVLCPGYRDADEKAKEAKFFHCRSCAEQPDDEAYDYIEELISDGYPGAQSVKETIYQWHVKIKNGLSLLMGSQQSSHIRVDLYGGAPGASTHIRLVTTDNVDGSRTSWTSPETCTRGGHVDASYNANTFEYSIFEREHTIEAYSDDGQLIGSWTGIFTKDFTMQE